MEGSAGGLAPPWWSWTPTCTSAVSIPSWWTTPPGLARRRPIFWGPSRRTAPIGATSSAARKITSTREPERRRFSRLCATQAPSRRRTRRASGTTRSHGGSAGRRTRTGAACWTGRACSPATTRSRWGSCRRRDNWAFACRRTCGSSASTTRGLASLVRPSLSTVRVPLTDVGAAAVRSLVDRIASPDKTPGLTSLATKLVIRESSGVGK